MEKERRKNTLISMKESDFNELEHLASVMRMSKSGLVRYLVMEAKKNEMWRNIIVKRYTDDLIKNFLADKFPAECTTFNLETKSFVSTKKHGDISRSTTNGSVEVPDIVVKRRLGMKETPEEEEVTDEEIENIMRDLYASLGEEYNGQITD